MAKLLILNRQTEIPFQSSLISDLLMMHVKVKTKDISVFHPNSICYFKHCYFNFVFKIFSAKCKQMDKRALRKKKTELYLSTNRQKNAKAHRQRTKKL